MANMPHFTEGASALKPFKARADIGLHLNLTLGSPIEPRLQFAPNAQLPDLGTVMKQAFFRTLDQGEITREIKAQLKRFHDVLGFMPDYIDGHQHVHILPIVRTALFDAVKSYPNFRPWIRVPSDSAMAILRRGVSVRKSLILSALSLGFRHQCQARGLITNQSFSGASEFDPNDSYGTVFRSYLKAAQPRHLVMCHPGYVMPDEDFPDPVKETRPIEMAFLKSNEFAVLLKEQNFEISRCH